MGNEEALCRRGAGGAGRGRPGLGVVGRGPRQHRRGRRVGLPDDDAGVLPRRRQAAGPLLRRPRPLEEPRRASSSRAAEAPDHFIDLEDYEGKELPDDRYKAIALLQHAEEEAGAGRHAAVRDHGELRAAVLSPSTTTGPTRRTRRSEPSAWSTPACCPTSPATAPCRCTPPATTTAGSEQGRQGRAEGHPRQDRRLPREERAHSRGDRAAGSKAEEDRRRVGARRLAHRGVAQADRASATSWTRPGRSTSRRRRAGRSSSRRCPAAQLTADLWYTAWLRSAAMPRHY